MAECIATLHHRPDVNRYSHDQNRNIFKYFFNYLPYYVIFEMFRFNWRDFPTNHRITIQLMN